MKKIYIHTFGCKVNQYESQTYLEEFARYGYGPTDDAAKADVVLVNSCTVTAEADRQCRQLLRKIAKNNPTARLILSGCYAKRGKDELAQVSEKIEVLPSIKNISDVFKGESAGAAKPITEFSDHTRAFVKIQDGCDNFCSYCIVPYVRADMWSKPLKDAVSEIKNLVLKGYPEIVLTGVHIGKYEYGLVTLINEIKDFGDNYRIRLSSIEPGDVTDELVETISKNSVKVCPHLHIPLQSGSDKILKLMRRPYTTSAFAKKIEHVKKLIPGVNITTDIITGFPGETEKDFNDTYDFIKSAGFGKLHVFRYSKRPGTDACNFKEQLEPEIIKARAAKLRELDTILQKEFLARTVNTNRQALLENSGFVLTDNYLKLPFSGSENPQREKLFYVNIVNKNGKVFSL
jgi:threonylcarbamoyladenosine tRNA methylthiotransferase MtaB